MSRFRGRNSGTAIRAIQGAPPTHNAGQARETPRQRQETHFRRNLVAGRTGKIGDWEKLDRLLSGFGQRFKRNVRRATDKNGRLLESTVVGHFENQDLPWPSLTPGYRKRKIREGYSEQILIRTSTLSQNIRYHRQSWNEGFVGVARNVMTSDGQSLVNIGAVHEFGTRDGRVPARPFVSPSLEECIPEMVRNWEDAVEATWR